MTFARRKSIATVEIETTTIARRARSARSRYRAKARSRRRRGFIRGRRWRISRVGCGPGGRPAPPRSPRARASRGPIARAGRPELRGHAARPLAHLAASRAGDSRIAAPSARGAPRSRRLWRSSGTTSSPATMLTSEIHGHADEQLARRRSSPRTLVDDDHAARRRGPPRASPFPRRRSARSAVGEQRMQPYVDDRIPRSGGPGKRRSGSPGARTATTSRSNRRERRAAGLRHRRPVPAHSPPAGCRAAGRGAGASWAGAATAGRGLRGRRPRADGPRRRRRRRDLS